MGRPVSQTTIYARELGLTTAQLRRMGGIERVKNMPKEARIFMVSMTKQETLRRRKRCPEGYSIARPGRKINMLGATELWSIYENHPEPFLTRIPDDFIETEEGQCPARIPKEWGRCLYYRVV